MPDPSDTIFDSDHPRRDHERSDANVRGVFWFAAGLAVLIAGGFVASQWVFDVLSNRTGGGPATATRQRPGNLPPPPRLEGLESLESQEMTPSARPQPVSPQPGYGWVDKESRIVRIPPDKALEILADKLPARSSPDADADKSPERDELPSSANSGRTVRKGQP
jgi:hypothetical protein